jgi:phosphotransferase system enzyme I (PtsP)
MTATSAVSSARTILTRLHDVMASRSHAQAKLNTVVDVIGKSLDSEVCSIYLLREGMLELFATKGLAQEAVHVTRMAIGEGLVGTIAGQNETLNLAEATAHPDFSYRPETGEDKYHSFAGVPIVRRERAVGVLCVQHADPRRYEEVEIEALQTVAMVLSELIANADLVDEETAALRARVKALEDALREIAALDWKSAATNCAAYKANTIAVRALEPTP